MATFNPADKNGPYTILTNGNLTVSGSASGPELREPRPEQQITTNFWVRSTISRAGKRYAEFTTTTIANSVIGIADASAMTFPGFNAQSFGLFSNGSGSVNGTFPAWGFTFAAGDVVGMAFDPTAKKVWFRKNGGVWNGSALNDPAAGTGFLNVSAYAGTTHFVVVSGDGGYATTANFGETAFSAAPPSGFLAWNAESTTLASVPAMTISTKTVAVGVFVRVVISGSNIAMQAKGALPLTFGSASSATWGLHTSLTMTQQGAVGDLNLMLALVSTSGVPPTLTPAGWTQVFTPSTVSDGSTGVTFYAWWKKTAAGDGTQIFTHSSANSIGWMPSISGAAGSPIEVQSAMASGTGFTTTATGLTTANANDMLIMMAHDWNSGATGTRNNPTGAAWLEVTDSILYAAYVMSAAAGVQPNAVMTNANFVGQPWQAKMIALAPAGVTVTTTSRVSHTVTGNSASIFAGDATMPAQVFNVTTNFATAQTSTPTVNLGVSSTIAAMPAMTASTSDVTVNTVSILSIDSPAMTISASNVSAIAFFPGEADITDMPPLTALLNDVLVSIPIVLNATSPFMLMSAGDAVGSIKPLINITAMPAMTASTKDVAVSGKANVYPTNIALTVSTQSVGVVGKSIATLASVPSMSAPVSGVTVKVGQTIQIASVPSMTMSMSGVQVVSPPAFNGWNHDRLDGPGSLASSDRLLISPPSLVPTESFSTVSHGAGTWYVEVTIGGSPAGYVGLYNEANDAGTEIVLSTGEVRELPSGVVTPTFAPIHSGDIIGIAYDGTDGQVWFRVNGGAWNNDPVQVPVA